MAAHVARAGPEWQLQGDPYIEPDPDGFMPR